MLVDVTFGVALVETFEGFFDETNFLLAHPLAAYDSRAVLGRACFWTGSVFEELGETERWM